MSYPAMPEVQERGFTTPDDNVNKVTVRLLPTACGLISQLFIRGMVPHDTRVGDLIAEGHDWLRQAGVRTSMLVVPRNHQQKDYAAVGYSSSDLMIVQRRKGSGDMPTDAYLLRGTISEFVPPLLQRSGVESPDDAMRCWQLAASSREESEAVAMGVVREGQLVVAGLSCVRINHVDGNEAKHTLVSVVGDPERAESVVAGLANWLDQYSDTTSASAIIASDSEFLGAYSAAGFQPISRIQVLTHDLAA